MKLQYLQIINKLFAQWWSLLRYQILSVMSATIWGLTTGRTIVQRSIMTITLHPTSMSEAILHRRSTTIMEAVVSSTSSVQAPLTSYSSSCWLSWPTARLYLQYYWPWMVTAGGAADNWMTLLLMIGEYGRGGVSGRSDIQFLHKWCKRREYWE